MLVHDLENNSIKMYSRYKEENSGIAAKPIRTLKDKFYKYKTIYKYMTWTLLDVHTDKLDDILNKYNNTYHGTVKLNLFYVKLSTYTDFH